MPLSFFQQKTALAQAEAARYGRSWGDFDRYERACWRGEAHLVLRQLAKLGFLIVPKPATKVRRRKSAR